MAIGFLSMTTPLEDRIDRWATSGSATRILLHPEDYLRLSDKKRAKYESQYSMPVEALGGEQGIKDFLNRSKSAEEIEQQEALKALEGEQ